MKTYTLNNGFTFVLSYIVEIGPIVEVSRKDENHYFFVTFINGHGRAVGNEDMKQLELERINLIGLLENGERL